ARHGNRTMDNGRQATDRVTQVLIAALKEAAAAAPAEQRLFRSGKLPGLFPGRAGPNLEACNQALARGYLEVVRTDIKGKTAVEWARITPQGVEFLHAHDSPVRAMDELRAALRATEEGIPDWLAAMHRQLHQLGLQLTEEVQAIARRLRALAER